MPSALSYPGVYVEEIPSGVHPITGVPTSIAAFIGRAPRGPVDEATSITSFADYERTFGGLNVDSTMSYAVRDFFLNGGALAVIVRAYVPTEGKDSKAVVKFNDHFFLEARSEGTWGKKLRGTIDTDHIPAEMETALGAKLFNLTVKEDVPGGRTEKFVNLSLRDNGRRIDRVLEDGSLLVRWPKDLDIPTDPTAVPAGDDERALIISLAAKQKAIADAQQRYDAAAAGPAKVAAQAALDAATAAVTPAETALQTKQQAVTTAKQALTTLEAGGTATEEQLAAARQTLADAEEAADANAHVVDSEPLPDSGEGLFPEHGAEQKKGLFAFEKADIFNILCIPPDKRDGNTPVTVYQQALAYCVKRRAMLIVDSPAEWNTEAGAQSLLSTPADKFADLALTGEAARNAAVYFPRVRQPDPLRDGQIDTFAPCGIIAGVMARTDVSTGVWKAPAGVNASLNGTQGLAYKLTDPENGELNPIGINCLRTFPITGRVVWGARTMRGADQLGDDYKYIPVRRLALFIEESLYRGTQWVVFEPNDEPLWALIRLNIGAFMHLLFAQGAFQGKTPREAYFVKCDRETTTQTDINLGVVNIVVGFAPLKPAEFVVIRLTQITGQIET